MAKNEISKTEDNDLMIFGDQGDTQVANYAADAGLGNENIGQDDLATPRIVMLQDLSKVVKDKIIAGAEPGMFHNTVTDEIFTSKYIIPLDYQFEYAVFLKRDFGGGYHGSFDTEAEASEHVKTLEGTEAMYDVVESARQIFLTLHGEGEKKGMPDSPAVMHFASTAINVSRQLNSAIQMRFGKDAPRFIGVWKMNVEKKSKKNDTWYAPNFTFAGHCGQKLYDEARSMYFAITNKVDPQKIDPETGEIKAA